MLRLREVQVNGHRTTVRLETEFWQAMWDICEREGIQQAEWLGPVVAKRTKGMSMGSAIRIAVLKDLQERVKCLSEAGCSGLPAPTGDAPHSATAPT